MSGVILATILHTLWCAGIHPLRWAVPSTLCITLGDVVGGALAEKITIEEDLCSGSLLKASPAQINKYIS